MDDIIWKQELLENLRLDSLQENMISYIKQKILYIFTWILSKLSINLGIFTIKKEINLFIKLLTCDQLLNINFIGLDKENQIVPVYYESHFPLSYFIISSIEQLKDEQFFSSENANNMLKKWIDMKYPPLEFLTIDQRKKYFFDFFNFKEIGIELKLEKNKLIQNLWEIFSIKSNHIADIHYFFWKEENFINHYLILLKFLLKNQKITIIWEKKYSSTKEFISNIIDKCVDTIMESIKNDENSNWLKDNAIVKSMEELSYHYEIKYEDVNICLILCNFIKLVGVSKLNINFFSILTTYKEDKFFKEIFTLFSQIYENFKMKIKMKDISIFIENLIVKFLKIYHLLDPSNNYNFKLNCLKIALQLHPNLKINLSNNYEEKKLLLPGYSSYDILFSFDKKDFLFYSTLNNLLKESSESNNIECLDNVPCIIYLNFLEQKFLLKKTENNLTSILLKKIESLMFKKYDILSKLRLIAYCKILLVNSIKQCLQEIQQKNPNSLCRNISNLLNIMPYFQKSFKLYFLKLIIHEIGGETSGLNLFKTSFFQNIFNWIYEFNDILVENISVISHRDFGLIFDPNYKELRQNIFNLINNVSEEQIIPQTSFINLSFVYLRQVCVFFIIIHKKFYLFRYFLFI